MSVFQDRGPQSALIAGGRKLHLHHGPIDLIIGADGARREVREAYRQATAAFQCVLTDLVEELPALRRPCVAGAGPGKGQVARRMVTAVKLHRGFITPMAAVAGAVADHILDRLTFGRALARAYVNNGGDIALYLGASKTFRIGVCEDPVTGHRASNITIISSDGIGGIATSGWRGRSHSLGIADAVTVLAPRAADADAAATLIANAVDLPGSPAITRCPANELAQDSDLGRRLVTTGVAKLSGGDIADALSAGEAVAQQMIDQGLTSAAFMAVQGTQRVTGRGPIAHPQLEQPEPVHA